MKERENVMKSQNKFVIATVTAIAAMSITQAMAQYRPVGDDGIAASPKVRQMLNELALSASNPRTTDAVASTGYRAAANDGIAASPKVRQMLTEQQRNAAVIPSSAALASVGYRATGADGITASPKVRAELNQRGSQSFEVAPVK